MLRGWLREGRQRGASDLHLKPGAPPTLRLVGALTPIEHAPELDGRMISDLMRSFVGGKADSTDFMTTGPRRCLVLTADNFTYVLKFISI